MQVLILSSIFLSSWLKSVAPKSQWFHLILQLKYSIIIIKYNHLLLGCFSVQDSKILYISPREKSLPIGTLVLHLPTQDCRDTSASGFIYFSVLCVLLNFFFPLFKLGSWMPFPSPKIYFQGFEQISSLLLFAFRFFFKIHLNLLYGSFNKNLFLFSFSLIEH